MRKLHVIVLLLFLAVFAGTSQARNPQFCFDVSITVGNGHYFAESKYNQIEFLEFTQDFAAAPGERSRRVYITYGEYYVVESDIGAAGVSTTDGIYALGQSSVEYCGYSEEELLRDGRMNYRDAAARAVIYKTDEGYDIYEVDDTGTGHLAFSVSVLEIAQALYQTSLTEQNVPIETSPSGISSVHLIYNAGCQLNYFSEDGHIREFLFGCGVDFYDELYQIFFGEAPPTSE